MNDLNIELSDIMEVDALQDLDQLDNFDGWDSLTRLSLQAYIDKTYNVQLSTGDLEIVKSLGDIKKLIQSKI